MITIYIEPETETEKRKLIRRKNDIAEIVRLCIRYDISPQDIRDLVEEQEDILQLEGLVEIEGYGGIVINEERARTTPCVCYDLGKKKLCFSRGIIGALSEEQIKEYCKAGIEHKTSEKLLERIERFKEAVSECVRRAQQAKTGRIKVFIECMSEKLVSE